MVFIDGSPGSGQNAVPEAAEQKFRSAGEFDSQQRISRCCHGGDLSEG
jgi:hypothetical protein